MTTDQLSEPRTIAGFWRRLGAFLLDCLVLGLIGLAIGIFLSEQLVYLGPWGRLLGFVIALTYFGALNSKLGRGQTLGKRLLKIKVVDKSGVALSVPKGFLRFIPLGIPWFLNNAQFSESVLVSFWLYLLSVAIFGVGLSVIYLYIFNRRTRQSLHDLLVGSYVVKADTAGAVPTSAPWPVHLAVCAFLLVAAGLVPHFTKKLAAAEPFASLMTIYHVVNAEPWVLHAQVNKGTTYTATLKKGQSQTSYLAITAYSKDSAIENAERAKRLAKLALASDSSVKSLNVIQVTFVYGYDIGIASSWQSHNHTYSPGELVDH